MTSPEGTPGPEAPGLSAVVRAAQNGDEDAFQLLYRAIHPGLIRYLWAHAGTDAEDLAAETWLRVARDLPRFSGDEAGFRAWVTTIARCRVLDHRRNRDRYPARGTPAEPLPFLPADDDTEEAALESLATADALTMVAGLPGAQAEAILLVVVMGLDAETAGQVLGKRADTVRTAAHRGLRQLIGQLSSGQIPAEAVPRSNRKPWPGGYRFEMSNIRRSPT